MKDWRARFVLTRKGCLLAIASIVSSSAWCADAPVDNPPELLGEISEAASKCRHLDEDSKLVDGSIDVVVGVDSQGRPSSVAIPEDAESRLAQLARCTALKLKFRPAVRNGEDASGSVHLHLSFPIPPRIGKPESRLVNKCFSRWVPDHRAATRVVVDLRIAADGTLSSHHLPDDAEPWMAKAADCVLSKMSFSPARLDGKSIEAQAYLPIVFKPHGFEANLREMEWPKPIATESEIFAAYRACYPTGLDVQVRLEYKITVSALGRVLDAAVVNSSGDTRLEEAGSCILKRIRARVT